MEEIYSEKSDCKFQAVGNQCGLTSQNELYGLVEDATGALRVIVYCDGDAKTKIIK